MKELSFDEIQEKVKNFGSGWIRVNEGESVKVTIRSKFIFDVPSGEVGLDGSTKEFNRWQCKAADKDGIVKVMTIQPRLAKAMLAALDSKNLDFNEYFEDSEWFIERIDQFSWKVELLNWTKKSLGKTTEVKEVKTKTGKIKNVETPITKTESGPSEGVEATLSAKTKIAYDLVVNNELNKKSMTYDSLKTVISSLTELNIDDSAMALQEMLQKKMFTVKDDNVEWAI